MISLYFSSGFYNNSQIPSCPDLMTAIFGVEFTCLGENTLRKHIAWTLWFATLAMGQSTVRCQAQIASSGEAGQSASSHANAPVSNTAESSQPTVDLESQMRLACEQSGGPCATPQAHTMDEGAKANREFLAILTSEANIYSDNMRKFGYEFNIEFSERNPQLQGSSDTQAPVRRVLPRKVLASFSPQASVQPNPMAGLVLQTIYETCGRLAKRFDDAGLSGVADYVNLVASRLVPQDSKLNNSSTAIYVKKTNNMFANLYHRRQNVTISPQIISLPPGSEVRLQSRLQEQRGEYEFRGFTNTQTFTMYRGLYVYTLIVPVAGIKTTIGDLNLIDADGLSIVCNVNLALSTSVCEAK